MVPVQLRDCPYCFNALDPHDDNPNYRAGVQCAECWTKYHKICWNRNGTICMKCNHTVAYDVVLSPLTSPSHMMQTEPSPTQTRIRISSDIPWKLVMLFISVLVVILYMVFVLLAR